MLLLGDMADLRSIRKHEVFLSLKKDLVMVSLSTNSFFFFLLSFLLFSFLLTLVFYFFFPQAIQATFRAEEMINYSYWQMKEEEGRHIAAMEAFHMAKKSNQELKSKLIEAKRDIKGVEVALDSAER